MPTYGLRYPRSGALSPGVATFPDSLPSTPTAYDEEGAEATLNAKYTVINTPDASYVRETNRDGTYIGMSGPGHAVNNWTHRQAIGIEGDYPAALTVTAKLATTGHTGTSFFDIGLSDNAAFATGNYLLIGISGGTGLTSSVYTNNNGTFASTTLPAGQREIYVHYQRNTAGTNNVKVFVSLNGRAWVRYAVFTKTSHVDFAFVRHFAGVANEPTAMWMNWKRFNDPRFLQPE